MAKFKNANKAFEFFYDIIQEPIIGEDFANTKAMFNVGFAIENPLDNDITCKYVIK